MRAWLTTELNPDVRSLAEVVAPAPSAERSPENWQG